MLSLSYLLNYFILVSKYVQIEAILIGPLQAATVTKAIDEYTASNDQINLSCQTLTDLARDLQTGVSNFRFKSQVVCILK